MGSLSLINLSVVTSGNKPVQVHEMPEKARKQRLFGSKRQREKKVLLNDASPWMYNFNYVRCVWLRQEKMWQSKKYFTPS